MNAVHNLQVVSSNPLEQSPAPSQAMTLADIHNKIGHLEREQSNLVLTPLSEMEAQILWHSARTHSLDKAEAQHHVASIQSLLAGKQQVEQAWKRNGEIVREIALLKQDLHFCEVDERKHRAEAANRELNAAVEEFVAQAKNLVRSYRRAQRIALANHAIPGASTGFPQDLSLSFLSGSPHSGFTLQQEVGFGLLPFELREQVK
jgi:hypothetical protein